MSIGAECWLLIRVQCTSDARRLPEFPGAGTHKWGGPEESSVMNCLGPLSNLHWPPGQRGNPFRNVDGGKLEEQRVDGRFDWRGRRVLSCRPRPHERPLLLFGLSFVDRMTHLFLS